MLKKVRVAVARSTRPHAIAALFAVAVCLAGLGGKSNPDLLARHLLYSVVVFGAAWLACRLFANGLQRRLRLETVVSGSGSDPLKTFVIYLELIKHVVGVSFTLGWIAGVMACWDFLGGRLFLVPLTASLAVSLTAFLVTYGFSTFLDHLHWPAKDEE